MSQSSPEPFSVKQHHHPQISATAIERPVSATSIHYYRRYLDPFQYSVRSGTGVAHSQPLAQTAYQNNTELTSAGEEVKNQHPSNGSLLATNLPSTPPIGCSPIQREHHQNFTQSKAGINAFSDNKQIFLPPLSGNNTNSMPRGEIPGPGYPTPAHSFERSIQLPPLSSVIRPYIVGKGHSSPMPPSSSTAPTLTTHGLHAVSHSADTAHRATLLHETVLPESRAAYPWSAEEHRKSAAALPKTTLTNAGPNLPSGYTASAPFGLGIYNAVGPQRAFETKSTFMGQDMMYHRRFKSDSHSVTILSAPDGVKRRTKTGCITCRKRRIKCDEHHPTCQNCDKSMRVCLAYDPIFLGTMERDLSSDDPSPKFKILHKSFSSFAGEGQLQRLLEYQARPEGRNQPKKMKITTLLNSTCEMDSENAIASGTVAAGNIYSCSKRSISMPSPTTWDELLNFYLEFVAQHLDEIFLTSRFSQAVAGAVTGMLSGGQGVKKAKCMLELQRFKGINPAVIEAIRKLTVQLVPEFQDPLEPLAIEEKTVWRLEELRITSEYQVLRMVTLLVLPQQNWGSLMLMHVEGEDHRISNNVDALAKMVWYFSGDGRSHRSSSQSGLSASSTSPNYGLSSSCGGNYNSGSSSESVTSGDSRQGDMPLTPNSPASTKELSELIKSRDNQRVWNLLRGIAEKDLDMNDEQLKSLLMVACSGEDSLAKMRVPLLIGLLYCAARYEREVEGAIRQELAQLCKQEDECLDLFSFRLANSVLRG